MPKDLTQSHSSLAPGAEKLRELVAENSAGNEVLPPIALNLVVVQASDLEAAKQFYECLGLTLQPEKHGGGPEHFAAQVGATVFEVYPRRDGLAGGHVRIGFEVDALQPALDALRRRSAKILTEPRESPWGLRAVVEDPDGNRVELIERH
jgi:lactoylglutathione lyase